MDDADARRTDEPRVEAVRVDPRRVDERVDAVLATLRATAALTGPSARDLLDPLASIASKGKRMRASLLLAAHQACNGTATDQAIGVAAALELFQTAALVHDDVLDRSDTRRGQPSAHRSIEAAHRRDGLDGDAERYGINGAILTGDLALMACLGEVAHACADLPAAVGRMVAQRFVTMASLCTAGQYLDVHLAASPLDDALAQRDAILSVMRSKTASYTTEGPLALGAALAGRHEADVDAWAAAGVPLGIAFQLRDDILGVVGSHTVTGKPAGDDLIEGKRTIVLAEALARSRTPGKDAIMAVVGRADADEAALSLAVEAVVDSGAVTVVEALITEYGDHARAALATLGVHGGSALSGLVDAVLVREA